MFKSRNTEEAYQDSPAAEEAPTASFHTAPILFDQKAILIKHEQPLQKIELVAVQSLIAYIAFKKDIPEKKVASLLLTTFGGGAVQEIPSRLYQPVIDFLVTLETDKTIH